MFPNGDLMGDQVVPVNVIIPDNDLDGFSGLAKQELETCVRKFAVDLASEANRLELGRRGSQGAADVSANDVRDALPTIRRRETPKKTTRGDRFIRGGAVVSGIVLGLVWDKPSLQDTTYLMIFLLIFAVTLLLGTLSAVRD
jgi:hypothetical protein